MQRSLHKTGPTFCYALLPQFCLGCQEWEYSRCDAKALLEMVFFRAHSQSFHIVIQLTVALICSCHFDFSAVQRSDIFVPFSSIWHLSIPGEVPPPRTVLCCKKRSLFVQPNSQSVALALAAPVASFWLAVAAVLPSPRWLYRFSAQSRQRDRLAKGAV